jgi:hypothetical protein
MKTPNEQESEDEDFEIVEEEADDSEVVEEVTQIEISDDEEESIETETKTPIIENSISESDSESESSSESDDEEIANGLTRVLRDRTDKVKPQKYSHLTTDPVSFKKAMNSPEGNRWSDAADEELNNIEEHEVWEDMWKRPESFLHTLWIFKTKPATLSAAERKKARLCIQGFAQLPEECGNTFAPTGKFTTLLVLLMFAVDKKLRLRQFDVKSAFLYAPLKEEVYIKTPEGSHRKAPYLKLKKSLYGLKQAPANWYETLTKWFISINF